MLDNGTKTRINNARDVLVGKVPDPKAQVEQITTALIYKFMHDMDQESVELGGRPSFLVEEYAQYDWARLMDRRLGGHQRLDLYVRALDQMSRNPHLPQFFRDIFKDAFLPYRDPETLNLFLKEINGFVYDHSERLGDAFEYLLSILGSQGAAGQFRTPRHIIGFIVAVVAPAKTDTVLDPACGTAGFLISAYKHILAQNAATPLTPDERERLTENFIGYDIAPEMVRLSLVNMYLHHFPRPTIYEYDTLTSEARWDDSYDVILANPPFMSPKGGIRPHSRFAIRSKRSEVLFVDYIAEHLNPGGRAGIIVPEGIIFQSSNAYKALRKMLVDEGYLWAVVSLPAGVFNPYSGVKTSVLLLDKTLAKRAGRILFVDVKNDGFGLGAQRRKIDRDDLPAALDVLRAFQADPGLEVDSPLAHAVPREKIAEDGDYNLSGGRYREAVDYRNVKWPLVELGDLCDAILSGGTPSTKVAEYWVGDIPWITSADIVNIKSASPRRHITQKAIDESATNLIPKGNIIVVTRVGLGKLFLNDFDVCISQDSQGLVLDKSQVVPEYLVYILQKEVLRFKSTSQGTTIQGVTKKQLRSMKIPLPPLDVQRTLVAELDSYQTIISAARQIVESYRPRLPVDPEWPIVEVGELVEVKGGKRLPKGSKYANEKTNHPYLRVVDFVNYTIDTSGLRYISDETHKQISRYTISKDDVFISIAGTIGLVGMVPDFLDNANLTENAAKLVIKKGVDLLQGYLVYALASAYVQNQITSLTHAVGVPKLALKRIKMLKIPLPPLETQRELVAQIEREQRLVDANRELIQIFQAKIERKIAEIWGE